MKKFLAGVGVTLALVLLIAGAYYLGSQNLLPFPSASPSPSPTASLVPNPSPFTPIEPSPTPSATPSQSQTRDNIIAAIESQNTAALDGLMATTVQVRLEATECCGPLTPADAIAQLDYLNPAVNWDFDPSNPTIQALNTQVPTYYGPDHIVGVAANGYTIGIELDADGLISAISMSVHYDLLITP